MPDRPAAGLTWLRALGLSLLALTCLAPAASAQAPYSVPLDNPFVGTAGAAPEVWIYGMRNPFRWSFDRQTGDVYVGDVGGQREEITFLPAASAPGANLGWNCFSGTAIQSGCAAPGHVGPAFEYPSSSDVVIGGYVVRDPTLPSFTGRYVYGRFDTGLRLLAPGAAGDEVPTAATIASVTSLGEDGLGRLYATSLAGGLYRLVENGPNLDDSKIGDFDQPVGLAAPPGDPDRLLVVEKPGRVRNRDGSLFLDIADRVIEGGEQGLLAMAVAPDYATSGRVFLFYTDNGGDLQLDSYVRTASGPDRSDVSSRSPVLTIQHDQADNHNGGQLLFGPDGMLYLSTGDGGTQGDPEGDAQSLGSLLGKIVRIDVRAATGVSGGSTTTPPPAPVGDTTAPALSVRVRRRQRVLRLRGAVAYARCGEASRLGATGVLRVGPRRVRMRGVAASVQANVRTRVKLRLTRRGTRVLRRALRNGRRASVRLSLRATDAAGNRSPVVRGTVRVRR